MAKKRGKSHEQLVAEVTDRIVLLLGLDSLPCPDFMAIHPQLCRIVRLGIIRALDAGWDEPLKGDLVEQQIEEIILAHSGGSLSRAQRDRLVKEFALVARGEGRRVLRECLRSSDN